MFAKITVLSTINKAYQNAFPTICCELRGGSTTSKNFFKKSLKKELTKGE